MLVTIFMLPANAAHYMDRVWYYWQFILRYAPGLIKRFGLLVVQRSEVIT